MKDIKSFVDVWNKIRRILNRPQKRGAIVVLILSILGSVVEMLGVSIILPLVQVMMEPERLRENALIDDMCRSLGIQSNYQMVLMVAIGVIFIYIGKNFYLSVLSYFRVSYSAKIQKELSIYMMHSYMLRGYSFFRTTNTAQLMRGVAGTVGGIYTIIYQFLKILAEIFTILAICIYIILTDWQMAVCVVLLAGVCLLLILGVFRKLVRNAGNIYYQGMGLVNQYLLQAFNGIKEVLVLDRKKYFEDSYEHAYAEQQKGLVRQTVAMEFPTYIIEGICVSGLITAVCLRVGTIENPAYYVPQLASFAVAAFRILPSIGRISSSFNTCLFHLPSVDEMYENIIEAEKNLVEDLKAENEVGELPRYNLRKGIEIRNVKWKYQDGIERVLDDISLYINKGEAIAFIGPSGAGKSTLVDIILGLLVPQEGTVLADEIDIFENRKMWSKMIGFVPQFVYLLDDTVRRNIAFGVEDNKIDDDTIWEALEQAQLKEFIESLPNGLETCVGERGVRFSGGQAQRLAIARALYTEPDVLILDEATSALDIGTETAVMEAIELLQGKKTLIIIAHRLSTIKNCDRIFEIVNGKVVEKKYDEI